MNTAYYTEWSKSEKVKQLSCINAYILNLDRWCWWTYSQGSNGGIKRLSLNIWLYPTYVWCEYIIDYKLDLGFSGPFLVAQLVKNLPAMQETWFQSLGWEDPLEKEMATHFTILAWKISWTEESGGLQSMGLQVRHNWVTKLLYLGKHSTVYTS